MRSLGWLWCSLIALALSACPATTTGGAGGGSGGGATGGGSGAGGGAAGGGSGGAAGGGSGGSGGAGGGGTAGVDAGVLGVELLAKLPGLWSGPATMTPLGIFPQMNFDLRP